ncbi:MAG: N-acetylmuramic acid 6-phosphate etherase [Armatimonadetes bacterium]|nr:N-acetylmuramic acid 6-phosphate etherase [Armatimonadota bacterium]
MATESRNPRSYGLDRMSALEIVRLANEEEHIVLRALKAVEKQAALLAEKVAETYLDGGRIIYVGSGTSGRIATMDAAEMPPTFGTAPSQFVSLVSGGAQALTKAEEDAEDKEAAAIIGLNELRANKSDIVVGLSASGRTAFVLSAIKHAKAKGIWTAGIANNPKTPLLHQADLGIFLDTGPEILTGSTRLKAGTSQKLLLNQVSTAAMVLSGKVVENLMVDVQARNDKLRDRCVRIMTELTSLNSDEARVVLRENEWSIRKALDHVAVSAPAGTKKTS